MTTAEKDVDPRVKRTRRLLQQALMDLLQEKSFSSINIGEITERATVNRATFYSHFSDKHMLLDTVIREKFLALVMSKLPPDPSWEVQSLRLLVVTIFEYLGMLHSGCSPATTPFDPSLERAIQQELAIILTSWLKRARTGGIQPRIRAETMASIMSWAIFGTAAEWSHNKGALTAEEMASQVLLALTEGVGHLVPTLLPN